MTAVVSDVLTDVEVEGRDVWLPGPGHAARVASFDGTCVVDERDARHGPGDFIVLPRCGEYVTVGEGEAAVRGHYLGLVWRASPALSAWVLADGEVEARIVSSPPPMWEVSSAVDRSAATLAGERVVEALLRTCGRRIDERQEFQTWRDRLVSDALEWADDNDLCGHFDDFMEAHSLPSRISDHEVEVSVTCAVRVVKEARDYDTAEENVDGSDVRSALNAVLGCEVSTDFDFDWEIA